MRLQEDQKKPFEPEREAPERLSDLTREKKTELDQIAIPELTLPKGGGALRGIDEKFAVNAANGTASLTIELPMTPNRDAFNPQLNIIYSSGTGNGPFGIGWSLGLPAIQRKTDKRLPRYLESSDEDVFMVTGAEDLVPQLVEHGPDDWRPKDEQVGAYRVRTYWSRIAGDFSRIERIDHPVHGEYWKVTGRTNAVTIYGRSPAARIADPEDARRIFQWLPEFSYDNKGNWIAYDYKAENSEDMPHTAAEANRLNGIAAFTNRYLKRVRYGNHEPYFPDPELPYDPQTPSDPIFHFELVFDYGEHDAVTPSTSEAPGQVWPYRADAFSSYRSGFEVRTARLCRRVMMFHHFPEESIGSDVLVRSLDLAYAPSSINGSGQTEVSYLVEIEQAGYFQLTDGSYSRKAVPPLSFEYQGVNWDHAVRVADPEALVNAPAGLSPPYQYVDFYGEGISGILCEAGEAWIYKSNRGDREEDGQISFERGVAIAERPNFTGINDGLITLEDLEANGEKQVVVAGPQVGGYFELDATNSWRQFRPFEQAVNLDLSDPAVRRIDLTGEGRLAIVVAEDTAFVWHASDGKKGFKAAERALRALDEDRGPAVIFAEAEQTIFLADMTGDGLTDIVRIRNGEICYWANKGYGRFGAKVAMTAAPAFDHPDLFDPGKIHLADITGTGASDLIYVGWDAVRAWINLSGNGWSEPYVLEHTPPMASGHSLQVADLIGNGTPCLIWSSALPGDAEAPLRYVDLMGGRKPHLMVGIDNNIGKETRLEYRSSTYFYLQDKNAGTPWITKLPFPVHVISRKTVEERVTATRFSTIYSFHHGYYDHEEREFRGFGRVDQTDSEHFEQWVRSAAGTSLARSEEQFQAPMLTRTWYHVGAWDQAERILTQFEDEYWHREYDRAFPSAPLTLSEPELPDARIVAAQTINDPATLARLTAAERREALRACKSLVLRQEIFALDAPEVGATEAERQRQMTPYSVATHSCHIQLVQPRGPNPHAVFLVTESEAVTFDYERSPDDPRIAHSLNLEIDEIGNVLEAASVVYGRDPAQAAAAFDAISDAVTDFSGFDEQQRLQAAFANALSRAEATQTRTYMTVSRNAFTNDIDTPTAWRTRALAETEQFEITGLFPAGVLFTVDELRGALSDAFSTEIPYDAQPAGGVERRRIEHQRKLYYDEGLIGPLPLGQIASHGLAFQGQSCAFTPALLTALYGARIADPETIMPEGRYLHSEGDANWWIPTGTARYLDPDESIVDVRARFFTTRGHIDPFGSETTVSYHQDYFLFLEQIADAVGNTTRAEAFDFRLLTPVLLRDPNDNLTAIVLDELGLVKAQAILGKDLDQDGMAELEMSDDLDGIEADGIAETGTVAAFLASEDSVLLDGLARQLLQHATTRFVYDLDAWRARREPAVAVTIVREEHHRANPAARLLLTYEHTDGSGAVAMTKVQAEPGPARSVTVNPDNTFSFVDVDTAAMAPPRLRWVGNGRLVLNNKGNPVKQYEPYFSVTPRYETQPELVESGVTAVFTYDPPGRLIRTDFPDGTHTRTDFDAWSSTSYDPNDAVLESDWHANRIGNLIDEELLEQGRDPQREHAAAAGAAAHADTPGTVLLDALGRGVLALDHNGFDILDRGLLFPTTIVLDVEGNTREVIDARGNTVMSFGYDMSGRRLTEAGMDAGQRWALANVMGNPLRRWDERGHVLSFSYDALQRPLTEHVAGGDGPAPLDNVVMRSFYGENQPSDRLLNLRGKLHRRWDTGGGEEWTAYDGKGNLLEASRRFAADYRTLVDWSGDLETPLETEAHVTRHAYDAINRPITTTAPDGSLTARRYNEAGLLEAVDVTLPGAAVQPIVTNIDYDAKGQREVIVYGNGATTTYRYDPQTFRLINLHTVKLGGELAQELLYTYDATGNITHIEDRAIPAVFFNNAKIEAVSAYTYDPLYRLVTAEGREHAGQAIDFDSADNWHDEPFRVRHQPGDVMAWRNYNERYRYDPVGNIMELAHAATGGSYTRTYAYEVVTNRLASTGVGASTYPYDHHPAHGFIRRMPHLPVMRHTFRDELAATSRQTVSSGTPELTYYIYDHEGTRIRKVTDHFADPGVDPAPRDERLYLSVFEIYRRHSGIEAGLERRTLSVMDDARRVAMIDTRNGVNDGTPVEVTRYQFSNHLDTAVMEMDQTGRTLSYEEYHPYGTTAYQATDSTLPVSARRHRYTGKERDEESGLYYHGARYYVPWLARWTSADPIGIGDGVNVYAYVRGSPVGLQDPSGEAVTQSITFEEDDVIKAKQPGKEAPQRESPQNDGSVDAENTSSEPDPSAQCAAKNPTGLDITELDEPVHYPFAAKSYDRATVKGTETRKLTLEIDTVSGGAAAVTYDPELDVELSGGVLHLVVHYKAKLDPKYIHNMSSATTSVVVPTWDPELKAHEETHLRIRQLALRSELQKDPRTQTASSPAEVEKLLQNASKRALDEISQLVNAKYDIRTIHGTESRPQYRWQRERKLERQIRRAERFRKRHPKWFKNRKDSLVDRAKKLEAKAEVRRIEALRGISE